MKGTTWNGDATITKGCGSSDGEYFFSVGNLVAFQVRTYSSPDGRSYSYGCMPDQKSYVLQEEILLEEYDNSTFPGEPGVGPVGSMDRKKIIDLKDVFWHRKSTPIIEKRFLLQILEHGQNIFLNSFLPGDIAEVRNHPGKFLHIYEIPEGYRECKGDTFGATVSAINLQKEQEDAAEKKAVEQNYRGVDLDFGITTRGGWYEPDAGFGTYRITPMHEYDHSHTRLGKIKIMPCVPEGRYQFYIWGYPVYLRIKNDGTEPSIGICSDHKWNNQQSWWLEHHETTNIEKGWIFVDDEDVYPETFERVSEMTERTAKWEAEKATLRAEKFKELSKTVIEKYGKEVLKIVLKKKGQVLAVLTTLANSQGQLEVADILEVIQQSGDSVEIANLMAFISAGIFPGQAEKVAKKAYAWAYLYDAFPGVAFAGDFDDARSALEKYSKTWKPKVSRATFLLGDLDSFRKLRNKLA